MAYPSAQGDILPVRINALTLPPWLLHCFCLTWCHSDDTLRYIGCIPDHDDRIEESSLSKFYDNTAKAWKDRFGVPYSLCGCAPDPLPGVIGKLASKIFKPSGSAVLNNKRPDLISPEVNDEDLDATHPSEHNSAYIVGDERSRKRMKARTTRIGQSVGQIGRAKV